MTALCVNEQQLSAPHIALMVYCERKTFQCCNRVISCNFLC